MARNVNTRASEGWGFPHPRGDGPPQTMICHACESISPPAWGWPDTCTFVPGWQGDFPTRVGMARWDFLPRRRQTGFPHPRGDGPWVSGTTATRTPISPPAWGWPGGPRLIHGFRSDFPTRVGMAPRKTSGCASTRRFPHPRGDGPDRCLVELMGLAISPPAWGWPEEVTKGNSGVEDFPTRVGMARPHRARRSAGARFPHPRGDGPHTGKPCGPVEQISPPAWGWPVQIHKRIFRCRDFPTRVGIQNPALPRRCGFCPVVEWRTRRWLVNSSVEVTRFRLRAECGKCRLVRC